MFTWLKQLFSGKPYRTAPAWETPAEVRKQLRCAAAGIDPASVQEPEGGRPSAAPIRSSDEVEPVRHP